ncbi:MULTISPECIES: nickel pincer cofactor-dependent isomerase, group 22 [unclassified Paenibacillus]
MCRVRQTFGDFQIHDIERAVNKQLERPGTLDKIRYGQTVAITAGSRGIPHIDKITKAIVDEVKRVGGKPFIIPAMGSHGGATVKGQLEILESYGINEVFLGCPVLATTETIKVGETEYGLPVYLDKYAYEADGIVVVNRVKPHTAFRGLYESGLVKMLTIGLGKQKGAQICHSHGFENMALNIVAGAKIILESCNILFGVAVMENAYDQTRKIHAVPAEDILDEEPVLLEEAKQHMPSLLLNEFDVLIIDEIGKNISGDGADPNITGNFSTPYATGGAVKQRTIVLDLTEETHGNACGLGMADFTVQRAFDKMDFEKTYPNNITPAVSGPGKIPIILANDRLAIQAGIQTCVGINHENVRVVRIKNTLKVEEILISESLLDEARKHSSIEILEEPKDMAFNESGNLF